MPVSPRTLAKMSQSPPPELQSPNTNVIASLPKDPRFINLIYRTFGDWIVESYAGKRGPLSYWNCICKCGTTGTIYGGNLTSGKSTECSNCYGEKIECKTSSV